MLTLRSRHRSSSLRAVSQICALMVAVLAASPFTALFSTFELGLVLAGNTLQPSAPVHGPSPAPSIAHAAFFLESSGVAQEDLKNLAWATAAPLRFAQRAQAARPASPTTSPHADLSLLSSPILRI